jgi:hypothetical protein
MFYYCVLSTYEGHSAHLNKINIYSDHEVCKCSWPHRILCGYCFLQIYHKKCVIVSNESAYHR